MSRCFAVGLSLLALTATQAWADTVGDCRQSRRMELRVKACTEIVEGQGWAKADKAAAYRHRGQARAEAGAHEQALRDFEHALALDPADAVALAGRAHVQIATGNHVGAVVNLSEAIRLQPANAGYRIARGHAHMVADNPSAALADFDAAIGLQPSSATAWNNRGLANRRKGDNAAALEDFSRAIQLNPMYALAYNNRGYAFESLGRREDAIADFSSALLIDPTLQGASDGLRRVGAPGNMDRTKAIAREGRALAEVHCARCHATGASGASPNPNAPEFRTLQHRHPLQALREPLSRGIAAPHDVMPNFKLPDTDVDRIVAYINSLRGAE